MHPPPPCAPALVPISPVLHTYVAVQTKLVGSAKFAELIIEPEGCKNTTRFQSLSEFVKMKKKQREMISQHFSAFNQPGKLKHLAELEFLRPRK